MRKPVIILVLISLYAVFLGPFYDWGIVIEALIMLLMTQIIWISQLFGLMVASLLILFLLATNFFTFQEATGFLGTDIVWLLFSTFIIAGAFMKTGLSLRISLFILKLSRGFGPLLMLVSFFMMSVLAFFIPANAGRMNLVITIITGMLDYLKKLYPIKNFGKGLMIGMNYVVPMSGALIITGTNTSIYAYGIFTNEGSLEWNYITWMVYFIPPILIYLLMLWLVLLWMYPLPKVDRFEVMAFIQGRIEERGKLTMPEIRLAGISATILLMWMLDPFHPFSIPMVGLLGALLTVLPYIGVWNWHEARNSVNWEMLVFFAVSLAVAAMLIDSGALEVVAQGVVLIQEVIQWEWLLLLIVGLIGIIFRLLFLNVLGYMTIMLPFALMIGTQLDTVPAIIVAMVIFLVGGPGFFLITQTPINMLSYQYGYFTKQDLLKTGTVVSLIWLVIIVITSQIYWMLFV